MSIYTDEQLESLVSSTKRIVDPPMVKPRVERGSMRNSMILESTDGQYRFRVFMRQSEVFEENFSIGLDYLPKDGSGSFCLLRCNGKHGAHRDHPHHLSFHVHRAMAEDVNNGNKQERNIEVTIDYASYLNGLVYFLKVANVNLSQEESNRYFPNLKQLSLFATLVPLTENSDESN